MARSVVIHVGLHKTGTRFLQRLVFSQLDPAHYRFNPPAIAGPLRRAFRAPDDAPPREEAAAAVARWRAQPDGRTLVLSQPHASGDMYGMHDGCERNADLLRALFPEARIVYVVRHPASWLQSAFRQSLAKDPGQPIERFLNFYDGRFHRRQTAWIAGNRNVDALGLRFLDIYRTYARTFGAGRVCVFTQEDLRRRRAAVRGRLAELLGLERLPEPPHDRSQNRSFSALAIHLFFPGTWLRRGRPPESALGRAGGPLRRYLGPLRRLRTNLIKHGFDRLMYVDWDLLARRGMREQLRAHYADEYAELRRIASRVLDEGPEALAAEQEGGAPARPVGHGCTSPAEDVAGAARD